MSTSERLGRAVVVVATVVGVGALTGLPLGAALSPISPSDPPGDVFCVITPSCPQPSPDM